MPTRSEARPIALIGLVILGGCRGEPSDREALNGRAFETLLSAASVRDPGAFEAAASTIEGRHRDGELSGPAYSELAPVITKGRAGDWPGARELAYAFRKRFGDAGAYFR